MRLAASFRKAHVIRSEHPLSDEQIRHVAPSVFADGKHASRSDRYTYVPTIDILAGLRKEGFQPFMACQTRVRDTSKREHTKHLLRLRHASQISSTEANEIVMVNSHDGTSAYQMLSGVLRFLCTNGLVCGDQMSEIRVPHKGNIVGQVVEGAFDVLDGFTRVVEETEGMKALALNDGEQQAFAHAALALKYDTEISPAPITERDVLQARRMGDRGADLWVVFNRVQENMVRGGLRGRNTAGRPTTTREVAGIDQNIKLNRALWTLAEEMRRLKAAS